MKFRRKIIGKGMFGRKASLISFSLLFLAYKSFAKSDQVEVWLTRSDQSILLQKQSEKMSFGTKDNKYPVITVDETQSFQTIDGFGYTLTGGSAFIINKLNKEKKAKILRELFAADDNSISISYLRLSLGASDLNDHVFAYDDLAEG